MDAEFAQQTSDLRQLNQSLIASEQRLRLALETGRIGLWVWNSTDVSNAGDWSPRLKEIFGLPPGAEVTHDLFLKCVHPEDRERVNAAVLAAISGANSGAYELEYRAIHADESVHWVTARGQAFFHPDGTPFRFIGAVMDITERKSAEEASLRQNQELERRVAERTAELAQANEALRREIAERKCAQAALKRSEDDLRVAIDTIPGLVWTSLPDGHLAYLNQRWLDYTGLTLAQATGWGWQTAVHPQDLPGLVEYWKSILTAGQPGEYEARLRRFDKCDPNSSLSPQRSSYHQPTNQDMSTITTKGGTTIYYKDWGPKDGPVVTFSHGWPLSSDAWEAQMFFLSSQGYRCIAHDRRGHGRSSQPWDGNEMDTYADDLAELFEALDLKGAVMIGHSTGGGEVARYIGRHGTKRVSKAVLMGAVPPIMLQTAANPGGLPIEVFDGFRAAYLADRAQFFLDVASGPFFGFNRPGAKVSQGLIQAWWLQGMMCGHKNGYDCIKAFSETDFTEDLKKFDVPTLIIHGDDDQIVPIGASAMLSSQLVPGAQLKIYPGGTHSLGDTSKDQLNADLLAFITS